MTGRVEELRSIDQAIRRPGGVKGVVLAGAAGVGKTRLAREALARAAEQRVATRWVVATASARALPLGAFAGLLTTVGENPAQLLRQGVDSVLAGAGGGDVVVGVDDAHLLDDLSALLVQQLALHKAVTLVATVRTGEPVADAVSALWKDGYLTRLDVPALSEPDTGALLNAVLGGQVDSGSVARMSALTRGNALFLRHLVSGELEAGRLRAVGGVWRWSGDVALTPGLAELVEARMGRLSKRVRDVVDVLALGEPLDAGLLVQVTAAAAVEEAEARGLVSVERDGQGLRTRLAHPLYGEVRRAGIGTLRGRRLRGRIATALARTGRGSSDDMLRRAVLSLDSDLEPDPALLTAAAGYAVQLFDLPLAERIGRAAVAAGGGFQAQMTVVAALNGLCRYSEVEVELAALAALAGTDTERVRATVAQVHYLMWLAERPAEAAAVLDAAEDRVREDPARLQLIAVRAYLEAGLGHPARAAQAGATALAWPGLPDESVTLASCGLVAALAALGRVDELGPAAASGRIAAARSPELAFLCVPMAGWQVHGLRLAGCLHEAHAVARECRETTKGVAFAVELTNILLAEAELARGQVATALRLLREARAGLEGAGNAAGFLYFCLLSATRGLAVSGDRVAARRSLEELEAQQHPALLVLQPEMLLTRAWVAAAEGAVSEAVALAQEAAEVAASRGQLAHEVLALHTAVCLGDGSVADRLADLATRVGGPRASAAAAQAAALAAHDGDALLAASAHLEQLGDLLAAADSAAQAAAAYTRHDQTSPAKAAAARAHRLAQLCDGARTPALVAAARPLPLTTREREIVTMAAHGMTNREIAARLVVSVRTVEGHLYRAAAKLGTSSRAELATLIHDDMSRESGAHGWRDAAGGGGTRCSPAALPSA
ncbi:putative HTH-type transcriptional regulator [Micromonospora sp. MH33]|uniref:helix-turn-helix transcriptional regulator n=1 Tax=Micromonospora sp. MH33 TaxID=1945509 RepID=UPI000D2CCB56|nr:LuxR family transcriptional regulator [Micromonospora sp. MH33]PSK63229.1 putative HTH-type transcriptional regulator [Micromonospora sp. MH33]